MQAVMDSAAMAIAVGSSGSGSVSGLSSGSSSGPGSSSSGSSSGYGSATTTPTGGGHYENSPTSMPMATIATVAPFYSEALTSLDAQQRQQQQQNPGHYYHQNYAYGNSLPLDPGFNYSGAPYNTYSAPSAVGQQHSGNSYPVSGPRYEKLAPSSGVKYGGSTMGGTSTGIKPQATATPFYAQPTGSGGYMTQSNAMYDPYKYKMAPNGQATSQPMMPSNMTEVRFRVPRTARVYP